MGSMIFMMLVGAAFCLGCVVVVWAIANQKVPEHEQSIVAALEAELRIGRTPDEVLPGWNPERVGDRGKPTLWESGGEIGYPLSWAAERRLYRAWREGLIAAHVGLSQDAQVKEAQRIIREIERRDRKRAQKP